MTKNVDGHAPRPLGRPARVIGSMDDYPLRDQIRDEIRKQISEGVLAQGQRLTEQALADEFQVSRIPVREALRMLQGDGLVQVLPRRGAIVASLSREDLEDLFDVRGALEELTFRLAARRATPEDLALLRSHLDSARDAVSRGDHVATVRANADFHESVSRVARNAVLDGLYGPLSGRIRMLIGQSREHDRELAEHEHLLDAIERGEQHQAAELASRHISTSKEHALAQYDREHPV